MSRMQDANSVKTMNIARKRHGREEMRADVSRGCSPMRAASKGKSKAMEIIIMNESESWFQTWMIAADLFEVQVL